MVTRRVWTEDESKKLIELITHGHSVNDIAEVLDRTPAAISARAYYLGVRVRGAGLPRNPPRPRGRSPFHRIF